MMNEEKPCHQGVRDYVASKMMDGAKLRCSGYWRLIYEDGKQESISNYIVESMRDRGMIEISRFGIGMLQADLYCRYW